MIIYCRRLRRIFTFPGVIVHEVAHKFFCDVTNTPVYKVRYFRISHSNAGNIIHKEANSLKVGLLIGMGPFIVNSLVCMLLTIPIGYANLLETGFLISSFVRHGIVIWIGYSIGLHAIPNNAYVKNLDKLAKSNLSKVLIIMLQGIICLSNMIFIGFFFQIMYVYLISQLFPMLFLG